MISAIFTSALFYLLPVLLGRAFLVWFRRIRSPWTFFEYFAVGSLLQYGLAFVLQTIGLFHEETLRTALLIFFGCILAVNVVSLYFHIPTFRSGRAVWKRVVNDWCIPGALILFLTVVAFALWHWNTPFPYTLNWDIFEHQTLVNNMQKGNFSSVTSQLSDTFQFDGYSTIFHWTLTIPQTLVRVEPLAFWWVLEAFHLFLSITAVYVLAMTVFKRRFTASVAAIIGAFSFESYVAYASLFLVPQTFTGLVFAFGLAYFLKFGFSRAYRWFVPLLFLLLFLHHYIVGTAAIGVLLGSVLIQVLLSRWKRLFISILMLLPLGVYGLLSMLLRYIDISSINGGEALQYVYSIEKILTFMQVFFGFALAVLLPFGILRALRHAHVSFRVLTIASVLVCAVVVSGIPYALKFYVLGHYLVTVLGAGGIGLVIRESLRRPAKLIVLGSIVLWFGIHLILNSVYWKNDLHYGPISTHVSEFERQAAVFLKSTYDDTNTLILSDPSTQYVLEAFSGVNSQGGAYMSSTTRSIVPRLFESTTSAQFSETAYSVRDNVITRQPKEVLLVLSGRLFQWLAVGPDKQQDISFNIWSPAVLSPGYYLKVEEIIKRYNVQPVYQNGDMVILSIPPEDQQEKDL